jgi:RNA polymerase sigma-70 factor, ECF subfamily
MADREQPVDPGEFDQFYQAAYGRLVGQLLAVTGNLADAEDVVQEAFLRALARWPAVRRYEAPELWVRRVALNLAISGFRRARRQLAVLLHLRGRPASASLSEETTEVIELLRQVPVALRSVLLLRYVLDLPVDEVAHQLGLRPSTVRGRLARARARLAEVEGSAVAHERP